MIKKEKIILCFDILIDNEYKERKSLLNFLEKFSKKSDEVIVFTEKPLEEVDFWLKKQGFKKYISEIITKKPTPLVLLICSLSKGDSFETMQELMRNCYQNIFFAFSPRQNSPRWLIIFEN